MTYRRATPAQNVALARAINGAIRGAALGAILALAAALLLGCADQQQALLDGAGLGALGTIPLGFFIW